MSVLVDTSIWIEFFRARPRLSEASLGSLSLLLEDDRAVIIHPIGSEVLSGRLESPRKREISEAFEAIRCVDPDWNARDVWERITEMAGIAHEKALPVPGIVDRMILIAAERAEANLWTLDQALRKFAPVLNIRLF